MTLYFIASGDLYSTYGDRDGNPVHLANGGMRRIIPLTMLPELFSEFADNGNYDADDNYLDNEEWLDSIRESLLDPHVEIKWCASCESLLLPGNQHEIERDGEHVCTSCFTSYSTCGDCEIAFETNHMSDTLNRDEMVCDRCRDHNFNYCEDCEGWYDRDSYDDHSHHEECGCESPVQMFTMPHHGSSLANDDEVVIELPAGTITDEGLRAVRDMLWSAAYDADNREERDMLHNVSRLPVEVGTEWQTRQGNFTKRLSRLAYKKFNYKITPELLGKIGSLAREHSSSVTELTVAITRDLNQSPEDFGNEGSCWWESYSSSRCALKSNGGFGLRSFNNGYTSGRVWVMPLKLDNNNDMVPTFETMNAAAFVVFNGYAELSGYVGARVMAQMTGLTYRKIAFDSSPMYVNGNSGYLIASEAVQNQVTRLNFYLNEHADLHHTESTQEVSNVA